MADTTTPPEIEVGEISYGGVVKLKREITRLRGELAQLKGTLGDRNRKISDLHAENDRLERQVRDQARELAGARARIAALESQA